MSSFFIDVLLVVVASDAFVGCELLCLAAGSRAQWT